MTPSGIEPATCRFVAQCLNHYATAYPNVDSIGWNFCLTRKNGSTTTRCKKKLTSSPYYGNFSSPVNMRQVLTRYWIFKKWDVEPRTGPICLIG